MATKPALRNTLEGILKLRKKTKPSMKLKERISHTRLIVKQDKKEKPNTTKINKMAGTNAHPSAMAKSSVSVSQSRHRGLDQKAWPVYLLLPRNIPYHKSKTQQKPLS